MNTKSTSVIDLVPVRTETLTPQQFVRLSTESPHLIARSRFVAPQMGRRDFGRFEVHYTVPILKPQA